MDLSRAEKIQIKNLLEDRISDLEDIFMNLTSGNKPEKFRQTVEGVLEKIESNLELLEKFCRCLKIDSEYNRQWFAQLLAKYKSWIDQDDKKAKKRDGRVKLFWPFSAALRSRLTFSGPTEGHRTS